MKALGDLLWDDFVIRNRQIPTDPCIFLNVERFARIVRRQYLYLVG